MRFEFFHAADGDSFLITSSGHHLLVDGGRKGSFDQNVLPALDTINSKNETLDVVCVSHIDADHITGILALFDLALDWRVYEYHHQTIEDPDFPEPSPLRPPPIGTVWHNGFKEQTDSDPDLSTRMLTTAGLILASTTSDRIRREAEACGQLATSIAQGIQLDYRLGSNQLNIPINPEFEGALMVADDDGPEFKIGNATFTLLGPTADQLEDLRKEWVEWLEDNQEKVEALNRESQKDADRLGLATADAFLALRAERAQSLADRSKVTIPNLASIMFLVEEEDKTAIITGDGLADDVISALERLGRLGPSGLHVDLLKVPHHGSENNSDQTFYKKVTADHYVIPADGSHNNPDLRVVEDIIKSRVGRRSSKTMTAEASEPFTIWITADPDGDDSADSEHLRRVRSLIKRWQDRYPDNIQHSFLTAPSFALTLG